MEKRTWLPEPIVQLIDRVEERLEEPWSLERIADEACFSSFHFHRMFRQATGETPVVWSMAGRYRLKSGPILETQQGDEVIVHQPVTDAREV